MLVISVLCFGIEGGLGGTFCGGDLLRVPRFLVVEFIAGCPSSYDEGQHSGMTKTNLN